MEIEAWVITLRLSRRSGLALKSHFYICSPRWDLRSSLVTAWQISPLRKIKQTTLKFFFSEFQRHNVTSQPIWNHWSGFKYIYIYRASNWQDARWPEREARKWSWKKKSSCPGLRNQSLNAEECVEFNVWVGMTLECYHHDYESVNTADIRNEREETDHQFHDSTSTP